MTWQTRQEELSDLGLSTEEVISKLTEERWMNMLEAARETILLAQNYGLHSIDVEEKSVCFPHLSEMVQKMETEEFSEGKMGRWLGWIQACTVFLSIGSDRPITLEQMREINRRWS